MGQSQSTPAVDLNAKRNLFLRTLKNLYTRWCDEVKPLPYIRDHSVNLESVFIENGLKVLSGPRKGDIPKSYKDIDTSSKRVIVVGQAGVGKSTLALKLVKDWCQTITDNPQEESEIVILLRLRQLGGIDSVYRAIKLFLLPDQPDITTEDIERILTSCNSVTLILDGYDEYPDLAEKNIVDRVVAKDLFPNCCVYLLTRFVPKYVRENPPLVLLLTGFNKQAQQDYVLKAVAGGNEEEAAKVLGKINSNAIVGELCNIPLLFVIAAHMHHEKDIFNNVRTITDFFSCIVKCLHSHSRNKTDVKGSASSSVKYETEHISLSEIAHKGLQNRQFAWKKGDLIESTSQPVFDYYIQVGMLREKDSVAEKGESSTSENVEFHHKIFQEWYAAFTIAKQKVTDKPYVEEINADECPYVYRFACGINPKYGKRLVRDLQRDTSRTGANFVTLCIIEQTGKFDECEQLIGELFSDEVVITADTSRLVQRSTLQLLGIASSNGIPIRSLHLSKSFCKVDTDNGCIILLSELRLPSLSTLEKLKIETSYDDKVGKAALMNLLTYADGCEKLTNLRFFRSMLPQKVKLNTSNKAEMTVSWFPGNGEEYSLDFASGKWKNAGAFMEDLDYKKIQVFQQQDSWWLSDIYSQP